VVAAPGTVGVEVPRLHAFVAQVVPGRTVGLDVAGRGDVVGGYRIAQRPFIASLVSVDPIYAQRPPPAPPLSCGAVTQLLLLFKAELRSSKHD